ncbi:cysteine dioxygenase [Conidiobolus coronatus NRRL 28638]|uniref:Cysteine dioxygenase n=1 Tax=Conidiobolus coronatus (strain ATCC 28846 / CBS 209.66 / NRRL 28638) TaxID=796925 RepID=A0A137NW74_CONC2|nr:cysteine dioxygenase [Conidiobolus coronatus NRRL 28638]|eukprot:KXN67007.1 cysteine dioxygenase [Conidiobolus coronatus NRRL 28638]
MGTKGLNSGDIDVNKIIRYMEEYQSNADDWERYAFLDKNRYTRNLIDDGNGEYNLILLVWGQNQSSSIHNHAGSHCIMKVLDGEVVESLYDCPSKDEHPKDSEMNLTRELVFGPNQVTYIHDKIGLHKVSNPSSSRPAFSLHLYSPPILEAKSYNKETGESVTACQMKFYSKYGTKVDQN